VAKAYLTKQVIAWNGEGPVPEDLRLRSPYYRIEAFRSRVFVNTPLIADGRAIGVLGADRKQTRRPFDAGLIRLLELFASQAAVAIQNARLFEQVRTGRERLGALSRRLVEVQEAERRSVARELHDEIGQLLTGLKLNLEMSTHAPSGQIAARLTEAWGLVNELIGRVRDLSLNLRPAMLDDLGLLPALLWHAERYTSQTNVRVGFQHGGLEGRRFSPDVETAMYRIIQEAMTNVARHAGVNQVSIRLWANPDALGAQIEDQGIGFDPDVTLAASGSIGLAGMRERATLLGGQLTVESKRGAGTRVTAELPLGDAFERRQVSR
jgi:signal transduction histidine kinase